MISLQLRLRPRLHVFSCIALEMVWVSTLTHNRQMGHLQNLMSGLISKGMLDSHFHSLLASVCPFSLIVSEQVSVCSMFRFICQTVTRFIQRYHSNMPLIFLISHAHLISPRSVHITRLISNAVGSTTSLTWKRVNS